MVSKKRIHYCREDGIEKSVPHDHSLSSLGMPCDAKRKSLGHIFLFHPHDGFLYSYMSNLVLAFKEFYLKSLYK